MTSSIWRVEKRKQSMQRPKFSAQGPIGTSQRKERLRELKADDEFCFRSDILFFRKRPFFSSYLAACAVAGTDLHLQAHGQAWGTRTSLPLTYIPGFPSQRDSRPRSFHWTSLPHMAAGLWPEGDRYKPVSTIPELRDSFLDVTSEECAHSLADK